MTTVWRPTGNAWWIWLIPIATFTLVGGAIIYMSLHVPSAAGSGFLGMSRRTELLVLGVFFIVAPAVFSSLLFLSLRNRERSADRIRSGGIPSSAEVLSFEHTGTTINNLPQYRFRMKVEAGDGRSMEVEIKSCVSLLYLHNIKEGNRFMAWIDPGDSGGAMVVDFGKLLDPATDDA
jgi:hypothetical protein